MNTIIIFVIVDFIVLVVSDHPDIPPARYNVQVMLGSKGDNVPVIKDMLQQFCEDLPENSNINVDILQSEKRLSRSALAKANDFDSCSKFFRDMVFDPGDYSSSTGNMMSAKLVERGITDIFPYSKDRSLEYILIEAQIVILVVAPDVKVTAPIDNMGMITYILCDPEADKSSWTTMATDESHVLHVREINRMWETLPYDARHRCKALEYFHDNVGSCTSCSSCAGVECAKQCKYYREKIQREKPLTTPQPGTSSTPKLGPATLGPTTEATTNQTKALSIVLVAVMIIMMPLLAIGGAFAFYKFYRDRHKRPNEEASVEAAPLGPNDKVGIPEQGPHDSTDVDNEQTYLLVAEDRTVCQDRPYIDADSGRETSLSGSQPSLETRRSDSGNESEGQNGAMNGAAPVGEEGQQEPSDLQAGMPTISLSPIPLDCQEETVMIDYHTVFKNTTVFADVFQQIHGGPGNAVQTADSGVNNQAY